MASDQERDYYRRRAEQERAAAAKADVMAARLHTELAARYAQLAQVEAGTAPSVPVSHQPQIEMSG